MQTGRPDPSEHHPYYSTYIDLVTEDDAVDAMRRSIGETTSLLRGLPDTQANHQYAPGKWTVKEVMAHLVDSERTFAFRAFWFARGGPGTLESLDQDFFVAQSEANTRTLDSLLDEFETVRSASVSLFDSLPPETGLRTGVASGYEFSVRSFAFIIAGHERHHRRQLVTSYGIGA